VNTRLKKRGRGHIRKRKGGLCTIIPFLGILSIAGFLIKHSRYSDFNI
jgi:hypothetical protein